jgi:hypothetical protein
MESRYYAIESETHETDTITHYARWGKQVEGQQMAHYAVCGRVVFGTVWEAGTVDGLRCKHCMAKLTKYAR